MQQTIQCDECNNYTHGACFTACIKGDIPTMFSCHMCAQTENQFMEVLCNLLGLRKQLLKTVAKRLLYVHFHSIGVITN